MLMERMREGRMRQARGGRREKKERRRERKKRERENVIAVWVSLYMWGIDS